MKFIINIIILLFKLSYQSGLRSDYHRINHKEEDRITNKNDIEDPLNIYSNFTKDIYTSERKVYCVDYNQSNTAEPYFTYIKMKYSFDIRRDKIKNTDCIKMNLYHPFIIHDKNCYISVEYEYKNKTFTHRIDFKIHENNILCFTLTLFYSIIAQAIVYSVVLYVKREIFNKDYLEFMGCFYLFLFPLTFGFTYFGVVMTCIVIAEITIFIELLIYPYSFGVVGVVVGIAFAFIYSRGVTHIHTTISYVDLKVEKSFSDIIDITMRYKDYRKVQEDNGYIKVDEDTIIQYEKYKIKQETFRDEEYNYTQHPAEKFKVLSPVCSCLCCLVFLVVFFAEGTLRNNMFKASRDALLSLEYQTIIAVVYLCFSTIGIVIYALVSMCYWCKNSCKCCNKSSTISPI